MTYDNEDHAKWCESGRIEAERERVLSIEQEQNLCKNCNGTGLYKIPHSSPHFGGLRKIEVPCSCKILKSL